jgi:hypothetical protein
MRPYLQHPLGAVLPVLILLAGGAAAQVPVAIKPPDCFQQVAVVRAEIGLICHEMGRPVYDRAELDVSGAAPREVYFQALTLFDRANRLAFEWTRETVAAPTQPKGQLDPGDVWQVVDAAMKRLAMVRARFGIKQTSMAPPMDRTKTPTDVFRSIVQANRQLSTMLDRQSSPSDVYQEITKAIGYTSRLLANFPGERMPGPPPFERAKRPPDVYRRLLGCFERVRNIGVLSKVRVLKLSVSDAEIAVATPSDVYDIAALLVSEVNQLHMLLEGAKPPREAYYPGRKLPSQVYQRAGILEAQLVRLEVLVAAKPSWLGN